MAEPFLETLVGFGRALREAGLPVGTGDVLTYCAAMEPLDPTDLMDLYWAGRTTLVTRRDQIPTYHEVFKTWFLGAPAPPDEAAHTLRHMQVLLTICNGTATHVSSSWFCPRLVAP